MPSEPVIREEQVQPSPDSDVSPAAAQDRHRAAIGRFVDDGEIALMMGDYVRLESLDLR
jgi:hypothetical protein